MRSLARLAGRYLLLVLLVGLVHLALLWLWDPRAPVPPPRLVKVQPRSGAGGDVVLVFGGDTAPTDAATPTLTRHGFEYPFSATLGLLRRADLAIVNLEAAVTESDRTFSLYKRYIYKVHPKGLDAIKWAGVGAVTLANNHILDYGVDGLADTLGHLRRAGVVPIGAGANLGEARRGVVFDIGGARVGVLSYMEDSLMHSLYVRSFAGFRSPGCARLSIGALERDISRLRRSADVVIVTPHWGQNYEGVTWYQRLQARLMVDFGADVVVGHGPHIHQPVGSHKGRPIIYSLGNYAFGTPGRDWFRHGLLARMRIRRGKLARLELIPLLTQNRIIKFKPERVRGAAARAMLQRLAQESAAVGGRLRVVGDLAVWEP